MFAKLRRQRRGADGMAEEGKTDNQRTQRAANQPGNDGDGQLKVFLNNPKDPETGVDFGVNLEKKDGRFVFEAAREDGLAYKTGYRSGDVVIMAYEIDIDNVDLKYLLKELRHYSYYNYLLGVERMLDDGEKTFIWIIFKITTKDGVPGVTVLETLENDKNVIPDARLFPSTPTYDFLSVTRKTYNIYIELDTQPSKYLSINEDKQLVFQDFNKNSKFFRYNYSDPNKSKGAVVAYSLYSSFHEGEESSPATSNDKKTTTVLDFPQYMTGKGIKPDARFWYILLSGGAFTLQSMTAPGMYLGCDSDNKAILSNTETNLQISLDEGACESVSVGSANNN